MSENCNYQLKLDKILGGIEKENSLSGKLPRLMLHACCAPCSSYVLEYLVKHFEIAILYYNPNISDKLEYSKRVKELKRLLKEMPLANSVEILEGRYNPKEYFDAVKGLENMGEKSRRCYACYELRMEYTARTALEKGFDYFTTTLSISPHKNADWINEIGEDLEKQYDVHYLYADFKKRNGYKRSIELSEQYHLYRQDFCGCVYSKKEEEQRKAGVKSNKF